LKYFKKRDWFYLLGSPGLIYRSNSLLGPWEVRYKSIFENNMRNPACLVRGDTLYVVWSRIGDKAEPLLIS
jgi:hypothetical protein